MGAGVVVGVGTSIGLIGEKDFYTTHKSIFVFENGVRTVYDYPTVTYNGKSIKISDFFVKDDVIVGHFFTESAGGVGRNICFQEFNEKFEPIGSVFKVKTIEKAVSYKEVDGNSSSGIFKATYRERQELKVIYDELSGSTLITFVLHLHKERVESSGTFILLDEEYNILTEAEIEPNDKANFYKMNIEKIYPNGDCLISLYEGAEVYTGSVLNYSIKSTSMLYLPGDGSDIIQLDLMPSYPYVGEIIAAENISDDGTICYGIHSSSQDGVDGALTVYFYNTINKKEWSVSVTNKDLTALNNGKSTRISTYISFIHLLKNGEVLLGLQQICEYKGKSNKATILKLDKNLELPWNQNIGVNTHNIYYGYMFMHVEESTNTLYFIQNIHPALFKDGNLTLKVAVVDRGSRLLLGKVDLATQDIEYSFMGNDNLKLNGMGVNDIKQISTDGDYLFQLMINGKLQYLPVHFK